MGGRAVRGAVVAPSECAPREFRVAGWCQRVGRSAERLLLKSGADGALACAVRGEARVSGGASRARELVRDCITRSEVHLVRRLAMEGGVGDARVVFGDVERNERPDLGHRVERVEEELVVLQTAPPRFDRGVRETDLGLRENALQEPGFDQRIDGAVLVLDAGVSEHGRYEDEVMDRLARLDEDRDRVGRVEAVEQLPREDAAREVSMTACRYTRLWSRRRISVVSMCQSSFGRVA